MVIRSRHNQLKVGWRKRVARLVSIIALFSLLPFSVLSQRKTISAAEYHFNNGIAFLEKQQPDRAIIELNAAIKLKPNFAEAHNALGLAFARKGNPKAAAD